MRRQFFGVVMIAASALLAGCDPGGPAFEQAAQAELKGDAGEAARRYQEVCTAGSKLCERARQRAFRLLLNAGWEAVAGGRFREAHTAFEQAAALPVDDETKKTAQLGLALPEVTQGLAYESALSEQDKERALAAMEAIAREPSGVAPKAAAWLEENRPALLLARVRAACTPGGQGSCAEAGAALSRLHPGSDAEKEARALVAEGYKRLWPSLKDAENLLIQRAGLHDHEKKVDLCEKEANPTEMDPTARDQCSERLATGPVPSLSVLEAAWTKKIGAIDDPFYKRQFEDRWKKAAGGEYDPEPWPKP